MIAKLVMFAVLIFITVFLSGCLVSDNDLIKECDYSSNNYKCDSLEECMQICEGKPYCTTFNYIGQADYCLLGQAIYAKNPEKVCNAIDKEFMRNYCLEGVNACEKVQGAIQDATACRATELRID